MSARLEPIIGESVAMQLAVAVARRYAPTTLPVLLVGATGTGKELFAQHIHHLSGRRGPFVDVDCGALPRDMVEGLLFGYRRGAFTGAVDDRCGLIEASDGGTLFLDELLGLPEGGQRKLLRVLDTAEVRRLGETRNRTLNLRIVAAAQAELGQRLGAAAFRRDLYERVAGVVIHLPPLAERPEDLVPLARYFAGRQGRVLEPEAERLLERHSWPGNVRELRRVIERAGPLVENGTMPAAAVAEAITLGDPVARGSGATRSVAELVLFSRERFVAVCESSGWHGRRIAAALGVGRTAFFAGLREAGTRLRVLRASAASANVRERAERVSTGAAAKPLSRNGPDRESAGTTPA